MLWLVLTNFNTHCCFYMVKTTGFYRKNKHFIQYHDIPSAIRPVLYSSTVLTPLGSFTMPEVEEDGESRIN